MRPVLFVLVPVLAVQLAACGAHAQSTRSYDWFDGDSRRQAFVDPGRVAVIETPTSAAADPARAATTQVVRIVEVTTASDRAALARGELPKGIPGTLSPVFTPTRTGGRTMALPGNVLLWLDLAMSAEQCRSWLAAQKVPVLAPVEGGRNAFIIAAPPGVPSIVLANSLRGREGVRAASPNWWQEVARR